MASCSLTGESISIDQRDNFMLSKQGLKLLEAEMDGVIKAKHRKNNFSFSKAKRPSPENLVLNHNISYNLPSDFEKVKPSTGSGATFGGTGFRFDYYSSRRKSGQMPGPT